MYPHLEHMHLFDQVCLLLHCDARVLLMLCMIHMIEEFDCCNKEKLATTKVLNGGPNVVLDEIF